MQDNPTTPSSPLIPLPLKRERGKYVESPTFGAVLLAAGWGSRMGTRPKPLLRIDAIPLIAHIISALCAVGIKQIVVVLGGHADQIEAWIPEVPQGIQLTPVRNKDLSQDPISSQRLGLEHIDPSIDHILMVLADQPLLAKQDLLDLMRAFEQCPPEIQLLYPLVEGQPGHPVILKSTVRRDILQEDKSVGIRQWRAQHPQQVYAYPSSNQHYIIDIDTPEDIIAVSARIGKQLSWD